MMLEAAEAGSIVVVTRRVGGVCIVGDSQGKEGEREGHKVKI